MVSLKILGVLLIVFSIWLVIQIMIDLITPGREFSVGEIQLICGFIILSGFLINFVNFVTEKLNKDKE